MEKYYKCDDCGNEFTYDDADSKKLEYTTLSVVACPHCHSIEVYEGYQCEMCKCWIDDEVLPDIYLCKSCLAKETKKVQSILQVVRNSLSEIDQAIYDDIMES